MIFVALNTSMMFSTFDDIMSNFEEYIGCKYIENLQNTEDNKF